MMKSKHLSTSIIYGLALFNILIHLYVFDNLEYHRDELLYYSLGNHPAFGYASVPPLIGWVAAMMKAIFGFSLFTVKLFPALLGGVYLVLLTSITREMGGKKYAQILMAIAVLIMPFSLRAFQLFQPVPLDMFFWAAIIYYVLRYVNTEQDKYLLLLGAMVGLALLNKYLVALLLFALLLSIVFTPYKTIFKKRHFYYATGIGLLIFLPNLIWQITHGLPVINHMTELNAQQLVHVSRIDFLIDQLMMPLMASFLLIWGIVFLAKSKNYRFLLSTTFIVIVILLVLRGKSYYTIGILPVLVAAGTIGVEAFFKHKAIRLLIPVIMVLLSLPLLPFGMPIYKQDGLVSYFKNLEDQFGLTLGRQYEDGNIHPLPQDYADMLGWEELTAITTKAYDLIPDKNKALIYCKNHGQAGAVTLIGEQYGLPPAQSFSDSYRYWTPTEFTPDIKYFIYINDEMGDDVKNLFDDIKIIGSITNPNAREYGTTVYLCTQPKSSFNTFWQSVLNRVNGG